MKWGLILGTLSMAAGLSITANQYSGTATTRDPCSRLTRTMYNFGPSFGDSTLVACDDCFCE